MIIIGLTFMSVLIFEFVEKGILALLMVTCCRGDRKLKSVISKNLDGHRKRNSKTSIMFTLALSFLIFAASSFTLLAGLIQGEIITLFGSDLYVDQLQVNKGVYLNETVLTAFLDEQNAFDGAVANYAYISASLDSFLSYIGDGYYS